MPPNPTPSPVHQDCVGDHPRSSRRADARARHTRMRLSRAPAARGLSSRIGLGALLVGTALLYLWNLSASGWANSFYSAAAQAGASNWTAMLFGSSDAANAITDRQDACVVVGNGRLGAHFRVEPVERACAAGARRCGGGRSRSTPRVRRVSGPGAALLAAAVMALTPGRRVDVPVQQPGRVTGARACRRRLLHAACVREGQQPLVVGRGRGRGRLRLSGQDAAGLAGVAGIHRGVPGDG